MSCHCRGGQDGNEHRELVARVIYSHTIDSQRADERVRRSSSWLRARAVERVNLGVLTFRDAQGEPIPVVITEASSWPPQ